MPSTSSISGWRLENIGPLTTTFTAPASCVTAAYRTGIAPAEFPEQIFWYDDCKWEPPADCAPQGSKVQSLVSAGGSLNPTSGMFIPYNSPGLICPTGWSTVGAATKINPTSTSISGAFNHSITFPTDPYVQFFEPMLDAFVKALDPEETAHLCCPSSYLATNGACYSTIPPASFTPSVGCRIEYPQVDDELAFSSGTFTVDGQTITGALISVTGTAPLIMTTTSFGSSTATSGAADEQDFTPIGVAIEGMYILVHQSSDITAASTGSTATSTPTSSDKPGSAVQLRGSGNGLGVVAACCLSFGLGALLLV